MSDTVESSKARLHKGATDLTVGSPAKKILAYTLPLLLGNVFQLFYSWTDAIMLGNIKHDPVQFSALSASMPVINLLLTVVLGFLAGAAVVVGQLFGNGNYPALRRSYSTLLVSMGVITLVIGISGFFLCEPLLRLINVDEIYLEYSATYLRFYFAGLLFMVAYNTFAQTLRCLGNSVMPLVALIICVVLNIGLDYTFVVFLDMNIEGVAIGTMIAQFISALIMFLYITFRVPLLRLTKEDKFDKKLFGAIVRLGVPSTVQNVCACLGFMVINGMVNGNGKEFTAAFGLGNRIDEILSQVNTSFGTAITGYAAQNKGKGDIKRIRQGFVSVLVIMGVTVAVIATLVYLFRNQILGVFVDLDATDSGLDLDRVMEIANVFLGIYLPSFILLCVMTTTSSLVRGAGAAAQAMTVNIFSFAVRVASAFILNPLSVYGVFYASPIGWGAGMVWALIVYFRGKWKDSALTVSG